MARQNTSLYTGRFAPSPTGPLHFGSLVAALGSYLQARSQDGKWLVRIEDIDPPREVAGSADLILHTLDAFGLHWDDEVVYQSTRLEAYQSAIDQLLQDGMAYRCRCTRKTIREQPGGIYPGLCRQAGVSDGVAHSIRVQTDNSPIIFTDALQGRHEQRLEQQTGDFVVQRRDHLYAYQLAVTIDDNWQRVTDVVRGCDLLGSTARQIHLRSVLGLSQPAHAHLPLVLDAAGEKLSKSTGAGAINLEDHRLALHQALCVLGQNPVPESRNSPLEEQMSWAIKNWNISNLRSISAIRLDDERRVLETLSGPAAFAPDPFQ